VTFGYIFFLKKNYLQITMEVSLNKLVLFFLIYLKSVLVEVEASIHDCWDPDKLQKMKFNPGRGKQKTF